MLISCSVCRPLAAVIQLSKGMESAESAYKQGEFVVYSLAPNTRLIMAENSETGETTEWKEF